MTAVLDDATIYVNVGWFVIRSDRELRAVVSRRTGLIGDDLDEVVAEAVCRALEHAERRPFRSEPELFMWIVNVAHRLNVDDLRRRRRFHLVNYDSLDDAELDVASDPAALVEEAEIDRAARESLAALPERQRLILGADLAGLPNASIAERHGMSEGAVESALHRARRALWREFARRFGPLALAGLVWHKLRRLHLSSPIVAAGLAAFLVVAPLARAPLRPDKKLTNDAAGQTARIGGVGRDRVERAGDDTAREGHGRSAPSPPRSPKHSPLTPGLEVHVCANDVCAGTGKTPERPPGHMLVVIVPPLAGQPERPVYVAQDKVSCTEVPDTPVSECRPEPSP